jgi:hypothetical protein
MTMSMEQSVECLAEDTEVLGENLPTLLDTGSNLDRMGEKPTTNRLSYGAACISVRPV